MFGFQKFQAAVMWSHRSGPVARQNYRDESKAAPFLPQRKQKEKERFESQSGVIVPVLRTVSSL